MILIRAPVQWYSFKVKQLTIVVVSIKKVTERKNVVMIGCPASSELCGVSFDRTSIYKTSASKLVMKTQRLKIKSFMGVLKFYSMPKIDQ